jgi:hypothetical protein
MGRRATRQREGLLLRHQARRAADEGRGGRQHHPHVQHLRAGRRPRRSALPRKQGRRDPDGQDGRDVLRGRQHPREQCAPWLYLDADGRRLPQYIAGPGSREERPRIPARAEPHGRSRRHRVGLRLPCERRVEVRHRLRAGRGRRLHGTGICLLAPSVRAPPCGSPANSWKPGSDRAPINARASWSELISRCSSASVTLR